MQPSIKNLTNFYQSIGADHIRHTKRSLLTHAIGVYKCLHDWGCSDAVCNAGLFHSIYGTELFQRFKLSLQRRSELQGLIGEYAEKLVFVNCFVSRSSLDAQMFKQVGPYRLIHRETGELITLDKTEFDDIALIHLCDHLEQVERSQRWDYRTNEYLAIAQRLGGVALQSYHQAFAKERLVH